MSPITLPHRQVISDQLKMFIQNARGKGLAERKRTALVLQRRFERSSFSDGAFLQAMRESNPPFEISPIDNDLRFLSWTDSAPVLDSLITFLTCYFKYSDGSAEPDKEWLTTAEAAVYLGISVDTMKKYIHRDGILTGEQRGHQLFFSQEELDTVVIGKRGRKSKKVTL
jgi:excisionase family DNA binding protein